MANLNVKVDVLNDYLLESPLVFVQHKVGDNFTVYQDGKKVDGIRYITITAGVHQATTHEIEYLTGMTAERNGETEGEENGGE